MSDEASIFLDATTDQALVKRPNIPMGLVLLASIEAIAVKPWTKKDDPTVSGKRFDMQIKIDLTSNSAAYQFVNTGLPEGSKPYETVVITDGVMVDSNADGTGLDYGPGKNRRLRLYREATGLNEPGHTFSPRMLTGRPIKVTIKHDPYNGEVYEKIDAITKS